MAGCTVRPSCPGCSDVGRSRTSQASPAALHEAGCFWPPLKGAISSPAGVSPSAEPSRTRGCPTFSPGLPAGGKVGVLPSAHAISISIAHRVSRVARYLKKRPPTRAERTLSGKTPLPERNRHARRKHWGGPVGRSTSGPSFFHVSPSPRSIVPVCPDGYPGAGQVRGRAGRSFLQ